MTYANVFIRVEDDVENVVDRLDRQGIDAHVFSNVAIRIGLDLERGDKAVAKKDGSFKVVQDALPAYIADAEIVEVRD